MGANVPIVGRFYFGMYWSNFWHWERAGRWFDASCGRFETERVFFQLVILFRGPLFSDWLPDLTWGGPSFPCRGQGTHQPAEVLPLSRAATTQRVAFHPTIHTPDATRTLCFSSYALGRSGLSTVAASSF